MKTRFLVATDMSARSDRAVQRAVKLAARHKVPLTVLHVVDDACPVEIAGQMIASIDATLARFLTSLDVETDIEVKVVLGDPTATIIDLAKTMLPDLLLVGTHRDRPFLDGIRETTAQRLVRLNACPVLMVADRDDHPYGHVVAATDFSPAAAAAITLARVVAPTATITPVHCMHVPYGGTLRLSGGTDDIHASFLSEAQEDDARWRKDTPLPDTCDATRILTGSPQDLIWAEVRKSGASLVTAGAHGRVGQSRALLGSVATQLLRMPPCDVLIARPE